MNYRALTIVFSILFCLTTNHCCVSSGSDAITKELKTIEKKEIPLPFHPDLVNVVEKYENESLPDLFLNQEALIEAELESRGIPLELKYLPLAFSGMRPDFQHDDRCGVWALPVLTGLHYGLTIDGHRDERFSVEASTKAALDYLSDLHDKYKDWWLSILAYASSPNALQHAISKSETDLELWDFYEQKLIPNAEIIRDFIACNCVYHDHQVENTNEVPSIETKLYDEPVVEEPIKKEEPKITEEQQQMVKEEPKPNEEKPQKNEKISTYKVKKGDTLSHIAKKLNVTISDIVEWNHLESDLIREGQELIIKK